MGRSRPGAWGTWLAVVVLVTGAAAVVVADASPTRAAATATEEPAGDAGPDVDAGERSGPRGIPVLVTDRFTAGAPGVLLGPVTGTLLLSGLTVTATAPRELTGPVELYVELAPGSTARGCLAPLTEPATTRVATLAGTPTDPTHAFLSWPVPQVVGDAAPSRSWCLVVEVLPGTEAGTHRRDPDHDHGGPVTAVVSLAASMPLATPGAAPVPGP